jgi:hypothetical protein
MADGGPLLELEYEWIRAFHDKDRSFLESLLAAEFRLSFVDDERSPNTFSRESWFGHLDRMTFGESTIFEPKEIIFGKVGVIRFNTSFADWTIDGHLLPSEYSVTDVFVYRDSRWQVTNRISEPWAESPKF